MAREVMSKEKSHPASYLYEIRGPEMLYTRSSASIAPAPSAPSSSKLLMPRSMKDVDNEEASGSKETQCD